MVESEPKKLFVSLPVLFVSANTKSDQVRAQRTISCPIGGNDYEIREMSQI